VRGMMNARDSERARTRVWSWFKMFAPAFTPDPGVAPFARGAPRWVVRAQPCSCAHAPSP